MGSAEPEASAEGQEAGVHKGVHAGEPHSLNQGQNNSCWWHRYHAQDQAAPLNTSVVLDSRSIPRPGAAVTVLLPERQSLLSQSPNVAEEAAEE